MSSSAVILFAHGAREPEWARPLESIRDRLRAAGLTVELAFLEIMSPSLEEAAARLAEKGVETVTIVPLFLAQGAHLKRDLPTMVEKIRKRHAKTEFKAAWARLIRKVYEADPLECPKCKGPMRVIALIEEPATVRQILTHLGRWKPKAVERAPPLAPEAWPANASLALSYHAVPDIA